MLTGELPFKGDHEQAVIYSILNDKPKIPPGIPDRIKTILHASLEKDPSKRYSEISDIINILNDSRPKDKTSEKRKKYISNFKQQF